MAIESDHPIAHVAKEIGVSAGLLGKWVKKRAATPRIIRINFDKVC
ncbi:transposase, partial [Corynebacterium diphtheriae]|nr:transposase-like protein [Corynebacterium diphtheriae PW8]